ncbi:MAG: hypothetical protein JW958_01080 [Candidatus Eisenbacteria bacterium]|nr:hypothetical protein [Candidatus Eisenbacteria bacterium]
MMQTDERTLRRLSQRILRDSGPLSKNGGASPTARALFIRALRDRNRCPVLPNGTETAEERTPAPIR